MSADHYFTEQPASEGGRQIIAADLRGFDLRLVTEAGVFSRERVDRGTRLLIKHMEVQARDRVLDLGCGYGVVGIVAALLAPEGWVTLVDVNRRAAELARQNLALNNIENAEVFQGDGFAPIGNRRFDLILLNPPIRAGLATLHRLLEEAADHLASAGRFYIVGRTKQGVVRLSQKMAEVFGTVEEVAKGGGFRLFRATEPTAARAD
ncbi:MAG: class I SAM-dependent methyltransferase [Armatimonadetes bacterium]|nr:class I SAM-dependent methyltransferase [Armatimonadota bacterium]